MMLKFNVSCLIFLILQMPLTVKAQTEKEMLERRITLPKSSMHLGSILKDISRQTSIPFSFNSSHLQLKVVAIRKRTQTLGEWLAYMQSSFGIHYKILGSHIVLIDKQYKAQRVETQSSHAGIKTKNIFNKKIFANSSISQESNSNILKEKGAKANHIKQVSSPAELSKHIADQNKILEEAASFKTSNDSAGKVDVITPINNAANDSAQIPSTTNRKESDQSIPMYEATVPAKNVNEQEKNTRSDITKSTRLGNQLQIATEAGFNNLRQDRTTLQFGTGFFIKGFYGIGRTVQLSLTGGILTFGRGGQAMLRNGTLHLIPVLLGIRKQSNTFYIEPQAGYGHYKGRAVVNNAYSIISEGAAYWGLSTGFNFKHIDVGMRYQGALRSGDDVGGNFPTKIFNFVGLHLGYNFPLK